MFRVVLFFMSLPLALATDPWNINVNNGIEGQCACTGLLEKQDCVDIGESFYKRLLNIIISRGEELSEEDEMVGASVHFKFSKSEFELLSRYVGNTEPLTPAQFRTIDGLLSEHIAKFSSTRKFSEKWMEIFLRWWQIHYLEILLGTVFLTCLYLIYLNMSRISFKKGFYMTVLLLAIMWEIKISTEEAEIEDFKEYNKQTECPWYYFGFFKCEQIFFKSFSHIWHKLHPLRIVGNLFNKLVMNHIAAIFTSIHGFTLTIKENVPLGLGYITYIFLNTSLILVLLCLMTAFILNYVFNMPVSVGNCLLNFKLKKQSRPSCSSTDSDNRATCGNQLCGPKNSTDTSHLIGDSLSGNNLTMLINAVRDGTKTNKNVFAIRKSKCRNNKNKSQITQLDDHKEFRISK